MTVKNEGAPFERYTSPQATEAFEIWAADLSTRSGGDFVPVDTESPADLADCAKYLDLDEAFYPALENGSTLEGHEILKSQLRALGEQLLKPGDFDDLVRSFQKRSDIIELIGDQQAIDSTTGQRGKNLAILTNHPWLTNIALVQGAVYCAVDRPGLAEQSGLVLSKTLGFLKAVLETNEAGEPLTSSPVIRILRLYANVYCSIPRSDSLERPDLRVLNDFGNDFNPKMIWPFYRTAQKGGFVATIAPSASLDKKTDGVITMKSVEQIVSKLIQRNFDYCLPVTTYLDGAGDIHYEIGELLGFDKNQPDQIHEVMQGMIPNYRRMVGPDIEVVYDDPRQLIDATS